MKGKRILADKATGKVERQVANPAQLRKVFAEYREAVRKDAEEKRYNRPEPLADAVVGVIHLGVCPVSLGPLRSLSLLLRFWISPERLTLPGCMISNVDVVLREPPAEELGEMREFVRQGL